ncbi:hypothetical protein [Streptomyces sp. NPDC056821]|uniref:hypothetical protein n=1 Tax=unclassified Streptomyces TaxID=2593676 RepID=UPI003682F1DB
MLAFVVGTERDPQGTAAQRSRLAQAGAHLAPTSTDAAEWAVALTGSAAHGPVGTRNLTSTG